MLKKIKEFFLDKTIDETIKDEAYLAMIEAYWSEKDRQEERLRAAFMAGQKTSLFTLGAREAS